MKLSELLRRDRRSLSFEVFPPKTEASLESVKTATEQIAALGYAVKETRQGTEITKL